MSGNLFYVEGDATDPKVKMGERFIVHVCNNVGAWGAGFVLALSKKWDRPEADYRRQSSYVLGTGRTVHVDHDLYVYNLIGQQGVGHFHGQPPIRYDAINTGLGYLGTILRPEADKVTIHMPRIGCGLAGGDWRIIEAIIKSTLVDRGLRVYVYDLPGQPYTGPQ